MVDNHGVWLACVVLKLLVRVLAPHILVFLNVSVDTIEPVLLSVVGVILLFFASHLEVLVSALPHRYALLH